MLLTSHVMVLLLGTLELKWTDRLYTVRPIKATSLVMHRDHLSRVTNFIYLALTLCTVSFCNYAVAILLNVTIKVF